MKTFSNPWYDARNQLSPKIFEVDDDPIEADDGIEFYTVRNGFQLPSILIVHNPSPSKEVGNFARPLAYPTVVGQCVTLAGAKRYIFGDNYEALA